MKKLCLSALMIGSGLTLAGTALAGPDCGSRGAGAAHRFERLDTNKDAKVTLAELAQSKESWLGEVDLDKDGVATAAELEQSHKAKHAERIGRMFEKRDANKDARLTQEESQLPERWFARSDANQDGFLTAAELSERPARGARAHGRKGQGKLRSLDQNADGKIEREEVRKAAAAMLERLDRNSDGSLTADELGRRGGRGHHGKGRHHQGEGKPRTGGVPVKS